MWQLRMHCNLKAAQRRVSHPGLFLTKSVLHMRTDSYVPAIDQTSDIAIRFSEPDF